MLKRISLAACISAAAFLISPVAAQTKKTPAKKAPAKTLAPKPSVGGLVLPVDQDVVIGKLPNGLTYYIRKNTEPKNRAELYLVTKAGSVLETDEQQGLAHFTEHMAFNGTRDFPKNALVNFLQKSGVKFGADLNAYTSFDETVYQLPLPTDSANVFEKGFDILSNWAGFVSFDADEINSERGVVLEEARLRGKNAQERMQQQYLPVLLNNSRYAQRLPIGKEDILKNFKPETIKSFYKDWYRPDLQAVIAVGDFDVKKVEGLIKKNFSELKNPAGEKPREKFSIPASDRTLVKTVTDKEFPYTLAQIIVKHPGTSIKTTTDYLRSIRIGLFNAILNARINELSQQADPPFLFGSSSYGGFLAGLDAFTSVAVAKTPEELKKAVQAVVAEDERAKQFGFTQTEFERAKKSVMNQMEKAWKERDKTRSASFVREYQQHFLEGEAIPGIDFEYKFYQENIGKISLKDVNALAGTFISDKNRVVIVTAPEKDKASLPTEQTLLSWISAAGEGVKAYVDDVSDKPLLDKVPAPGKVSAEKKIDKISTVELTLSNGIKVFLKPTDFKNDQILLNGYSPGGSSLVSDADYASASFADQVIGSSGVGPYTEIQLGKQLSGKTVNVSPYIGETSEGFSGSTSPRDLETALQLIYLYFTQPRKDQNIWSSNIAQTRSVLANRSLDPQNVFQDTVSAVLSGHSLRRMTPTKEMIASASLDKAYSIYKDRFADASDFTFTFVGNFDIARIKPLLETYLGSLPSTKRNERYKDLGIRIPAGLVSKTVNKGVGEKSSVQLVFSGDYSFTNVTNVQMDALEEILNIKLIERLREKEGGVYSPGVRVSYTKIPAQRYTATVYFSCGPENVDKLINATLEEIDKIRKNGAEQGDIQKFVAEQTRQTEVQLKQNGFWLGYISGQNENGQPLDEVLTYTDDLKKV
ncbi:MAG: insulinase family protein, partial [Mucilaginibacter polytrichastri]|nr:insulinase family protein [Mucilaginibacter polytrichastri]